ncbi:complement factor B-like [Bufo gargarizans]|uniref:complement factor B-like n=1 Tax=Bufo gargarizans TaxID=30331 RepID=UPI001CF1171A|nr:complement factor B-like [Bufo gargarizans]
MGDNRYKMLPLILLSQMALSIAAPTNQCDLSKIAIAGGEYNLTDGANIGSKVVYTCPEGQYPHPFPSRECLFNGQWSNAKEKSQCRLSIAAPTNQCDLSKIAIAGGEYNLTDGANVGSKVVYTCPEGQYPHPFPSRECLFNGQWSNAKEKSQCRLSIAAPTNQCDLSKIAIAGGEYNLTDGANVGSKVVYTCPEGQYPHPFPSRECLFNGQWSNAKEKSQCRRVQCPRLDRIDSGEVYPRKTKHFVGDVVNFECWGGFEMFGTENRTCQANGKWSGIDVKCDDKEGDCPNPGIPPGATKTGTSYMIENKVKYECDKGLQMFGSKERVCMESKRWSGAEPSCRYWYMFDSPKEVAENFASSLYETAESSNLNKADEWTQHPIRGRTGYFMNIFIVLDASGSLGKDNFDIAKEASEVFIEKMSSFDFFPRYSIISFATEAKTIIDLSDDDSTEAYKVIDKLKEFEYSEHGNKQGTNTRGALAKVYTMLSLQNVSDPENFLKTKNVILLITDGNHNMGGDPTVEVKRIREILDIKDSEREDYLDIYVFGMGKEISHNKINDIASKKSSQKHVFSMETVDDMKKAFDEMIDSAGTLHMCGLAKEPSKDEKVDVKYPWIAKITITRPGSQETCKGSIISRDFILTAAHCFNLDEELHAISVEVGGRQYKVKNLHRHNKYNPAGKQDKKVEKSFDYDLALIELKTKIEFSSNRRPICLPCTSGTSWALRKLGKSVTCSDHEKEILSSEAVKAMFVAEERKNQLERKDVLIKRGSKRQACLDDTKKMYKFKDIPDIRDAVTDNFLCTGGIEPQVDPQTCKGDSGGPVIVQYKQRYIQVGVISWRTINSCTGTRRNKGPVPSLSRDFHTDLFHMLDWLKEKAYELDFLE